MKIMRSAIPFRRVTAAAVIALALSQLPMSAGAQDGAAEPAPAAATPAPSPKVLASWRGKVLAHLNSHKRQLANSTDGISTVAFAIDRSGHVLSARILKSSGSSTLDKEAMELTKRASPVPAPPSDLTGPKLYLTVPIKFSR